MTDARSQTDASAGDDYLLLADISGHTAFLEGVEQVHHVDFSGGIPAGYAVLGALLEVVIDGLRPDFEIAKLEGDAVFAVSPAAILDGRGDEVIDRLRDVHAAFLVRRTAAEPATDHLCTACPIVSNLDLKIVLHRGRVVRQTVGTHSELLGPAVNVVHRLVKNTVGPRIGRRPYLLMTIAAAIGLGQAEAGLEHFETYPDVGTVGGRIVELESTRPGQAASVSAAGLPRRVPGSATT